MPSLIKKNLLKIIRIKRRIKHKDLISVIHLIKKENIDSILAKLSNNFIKDYIQLAIRSDYFYLFLLKNKKNNVIGYSLYVTDENYLIKIFEKKKFLIFKDLLLNFNFITLFNLFLVFFKIDYFFFHKNNKIFLNLNLLALSKKYQSRGLGKYFVEKTIEKIKLSRSFNLLRCEAPNHKVLSFYLKKIKFKLIGKKLRLFNSLYILEKKIK